MKIIHVLAALIVSIAAGAKEGLSAEFITKLLNAIHEESLRIEESLRSGNAISQ